MIQLVLGGARSGKSRYAEYLAKKASAEREKQVVYMATARADDAEMRQRIEQHRSRRPQHWVLVEETLDLAGRINALSQNQVALVDCLTLWLSNWLGHNRSGQWRQAKAELIEALRKTNADIILVSNEVGSGIVPLGQLSRSFVDEAGWLNQTLAQIADNSVLVVAGCALPLTPFERD